MTVPWKAERILTEKDALTIIDKQFPELQSRTIQLIGAGWDNTAYLINDSFIFRFPRREVSLPLLMIEWELLPRIHNYLLLPIPVPEWKGLPSSIFP